MVLLLGLAGTGQAAARWPDNLVNGGLTITASFPHTSAACVRTVRLMDGRAP